MESVDEVKGRPTKINDKVGLPGEVTEPIFGTGDSVQLLYRAWKSKNIM